MNLPLGEPPVIQPLTRLVDQSMVDRYALAARDPNPIHRPSPEAEEGPFGRPVAHGMLVLALVSEVMTLGFGRRWADTGSLKVRWRSPAVPPISVTCRAALKSAHEGLAVYDVVCEDPTGVVLLDGTASARFL
ncbi:MAG: MaoC family dehydratase [Dehalococcoidia bacterium]|nr:MaoC family dehydratase [Dehalococcoidia bacterium]